jgi:hypothetical protein
LALLLVFSYADSADSANSFVTTPFGAVGDAAFAFEVPGSEASDTELDAQPATVMAVVRLRASTAR